MTARGRRLSALGIAVAVLVMVRVLSVLVDGSTTWRSVRAADGPTWVSQAVTPTATVTTTATTVAPTSEPATPWVIVVTREVPVTTTPPPLRFWVEAQPGTVLAGARRPVSDPGGMGESWGYIGTEDLVRAGEWWAAGGYDYQVTCYDVVPTETPEPEPTATSTPARMYMPWAWKPRARR